MRVYVSLASELKQNSKQWMADLVVLKVGLVKTV